MGRFHPKHMSAVGKILQSCVFFVFFSATLDRFYALDFSLGGRGGNALNQFWGPSEMENGGLLVAEREGGRRKHRA